MGPVLDFPAEPLDYTSFIDIENCDRCIEIICINYAR
jgi:hypothetical protein